MPKRSLKDIAKDMRAMGQMLIEGADELEKTAALIASVDLTALVSLVGGGSVETGPFALSASTSAKPGRRRRAQGHRHLDKEQKTAIRESWNRLPENARTPAMRAQLAERYEVSKQTITAILCNNMDKARAVRMARLGVVSKRNSMAS